MVGPLLLCAVSALFGFAFGEVFSRLAETVRGYAGAFASGCGVVLVLALACALVPLAVVRAVSPGFVAAIPCAGALAVMAAGSPLRKVRGGKQAIALGSFLLLPDAELGSGSALFVGWFALLAHIKETDRVPGVSAALYGPALACAGALLALHFQTAEGLAGLAAAGVLLAIHHGSGLRSGGSGALILTGLTLLLAGELAARGAWFAVLVLWSFPLVSIGCSARAACPPDAFAQAQRRGEPAGGLARAAGSLACANLVLAVVMSGQSAAVQAGVAAFSLFLAIQFRQFLARSRLGTSLRARAERQF